MSNKKLETLAYRLKNIDGLKKLFQELNFDIIDEPVNKEKWSQDQKDVVQEARVIARKNDYSIYYIHSNTNAVNLWKNIASKIIKEKLGLCMVCTHNPNEFKWLFSSLSKEFSSSFSETRHFPIDIEDTGAPKSFVDFLENMMVDENSTAMSIKSQISEAFNNISLELHDELTVNVFKALKKLSEGIIYNEENEFPLTNESLEIIREEVFILLYRMIFILYAEDRNIFPVSDKIYYNNFSLKKIKKEWILEKNNNKELGDYEVQQYLKNLFTIISEGSEYFKYDKEEFYLRPHYGRLFDKKIHNKLEKWKISNDYLIKTIDLLTRTMDSKGNYFFLDYSVLETRHLGSIYEHLLEFHLKTDGKEIQELPDPRDRKISASYYTPKYVVDYIVKNSIEPEILKIIEYSNDKESRIEKILSLKILDPAMGSGHFLVGAIEYLAKRICEIESDSKDFSERKYIERKRDVVRRCIYGVDLNPLAVDLAKLSLWLETLSSEKPLTFFQAHLKHGNSLVGERMDKIFDAQQVFFETQTRTQLKKNVKDYLAFEFLEDDTVSAVKAKIEKYSKMHEKGTFYHKLRRLLDHMIGESYGLKIIPWKEFRQKLGTESLDFYSTFDNKESGLNVKQLREKIDFFHWEIEFPEIFFDQNGETKKDAGFDVIIGNPPYIKEYSHRQVFDDLKKCKVPNVSYYQGKMDYWYIFSCMSLDLLKKNGHHGFVATNNWVTSSGAGILRNKILNESIIKNFVDFGDFKVFRKIGNQKVGQQTMMYILEKNSDGKNFDVDYVHIDDPKISDNIVEDFILNGTPNSKISKFSTTVKREKDKKIHFLESTVNKLKEKIVEKGDIFLTKDEVAQGIVTPQDNVIESHLEKIKNVSKGDGIFVISDEELKTLQFNDDELKLIKPLYTTDELSRYYANEKNKFWVIYTNTQTIKNMKKIPNIKKHLDKFTKIITSDFAPYGLHRARNENFFNNEKILSLRKTSIPNFSYSNFPSYVLQTYFVIKTKRINLKYLTALFNSKLGYFFLYHEKRQGENIQVDKEPLQNFPIKKASKEIEKNIIGLVDLILESKSDNSDTKIDENIIKEIDHLIFQIYELNEDEISIVQTR